MRFCGLTELHAHLSGSLPRDWILKKAIEYKIDEKKIAFLRSSTKPTLETCFNIFPIIHEILSKVRRCIIMLYHLLHIMW